MDPIKEAFSKIREDMEFLYSELGILRENLEFFSAEISILKQEISSLKEGGRQESFPTETPKNPSSSTQSSTHSLLFRPPEDQNSPPSTGNEGVPTDRQTDQQTDRQTQKPAKILEGKEESPIENAVKILDSLDGLKKEIRLKFKRLTDQEMLVFTILYQLDEETGPTDYKTLSSRLNLSESSIRDYIGRLIKKGIPIEKKRVNNKTILLSVSNGLKKIASLSTILQLKDL